ncbi:MAG: tRNA (adenosine(37)-N6)-dimethylallyltransferase MiaA [Betaproteobacteria bacterium]|nr:tRNA (adenosine(37)-N6)-dimethylallyltransferase MiaA [Betaproteobacteria bacterium]
MAKPHHPPAIILMGPTASGKTALSASLAQSLQCEIISVDSAQIYKHMNIGTAKPEAEFLKQTPHHGIDIIEPHETYSAAKFRDDALVHMREITERGKIPLLVGGTMLYFKALIEGMNDLPKADPMVRLMIDTLAEEKGWPGVHANLMAVDPETAARLDPNDSQRIQRALEIYHLTGKPMSEWLAKPKYVYFPYTPINIAITPSDRGVLHERIAQRFQQMLEAGLIDEVARLRDEYALEPTMPSMRCVGYRQTWQHLNGAFGIPELFEQGVAATRQLAKRQLTWLRAMEDEREVAQFDCLASDMDERVLDYIRQELEAHYLGGEAQAGRRE